MGNGTDGSSTENGAASSVVKADGSLKKKKKEIKSNGEVVSENVVQKATSAEVSKDIPLENKKKRKLSESNEDLNNVTSAAVDESNSDSTKDMKKVSNSEVNGDLPNTDENVKQKKKKKREMYRVDSDICFGNPSLSATNLVALNSEETPKKEESRLPSIQETAAEPTPEGSPELKSSGSLKKKKKMGRQTAGSSLKLSPEGDNDSKGLAESSVSKTFEEVNDWDSPLKPGETEIVLPSKSYKGSVKLKEAVSEEPQLLLS